MIDARLRLGLEKIASQTPLLVATDYDGVLAPIVDDPDAAFPDRKAMEALVRLGQFPGTHTVAISGRALATLASLTGRPPGVALIGTHGAEESGYAVPSDLVERVARLQTALASLAERHPGSAVERKPIGAAFHYRHTAHPDRAAAAARALAEEVGARTISGKMVVECVFGDADKGSAVRRLRSRYRADSVLFIGDDTTDEDAFAVLESGDVGVKVGPGETAAGFRVASQSDVSAVLTLLAELRALGDQP